MCVCTCLLHMYLSTHAADIDINVDTELDALKRENEKLRTQLALVQSPGEIMDTQMITGVLYPLYVYTIHGCTYFVSWEAIQIKGADR